MRRDVIQLNPYHYIKALKRLKYHQTNSAKRMNTTVLDEQLEAKRDELEQQVLFLESFNVNSEVIAYKRRQLEEVTAQMEERHERRMRITELKQRTNKILRTPIMLRDLYALSQSSLRRERLL
jgi:Zn-dependent peptidase ImmA (M78 family)